MGRLREGNQLNREEFDRWLENGWISLRAVGVLRGELQMCTLELGQHSNIERWTPLSEDPIICPCTSINKAWYRRQ